MLIKNVSDNRHQCCLTLAEITDVLSSLMLPRGVPAQNILTLFKKRAHHRQLVFDTGHLNHENTRYEERCLPLNLCHRYALIYQNKKKAPAVGARGSIYQDQKKGSNVYGRTILCAVSSEPSQSILELIVTSPGRSWARYL